MNAQPTHAIKEPTNLSPRIQWLRDYYFQGLDRAWNNEWVSWTTGTSWDFQYEELPFYIVPESYAFFPTFRAAFKQTARPVELPSGFWSWTIPERKAWFIKEVMVNYLPQEILPGDLIAGGRFNVQTSTCLTRREAKEYAKRVYAKGGTRQQPADVGGVVDAVHAEADEEVECDEQPDLHGQVAGVARQRRHVHAVRDEQDAEEAEDPAAGTDTEPG